jgi:hypothetical protein
VVQVDAHDGGGERLHHVGGVEPASHPHLEDRGVDRAVAEVGEGGGGQGLEVGGMAGDRPFPDEGGGGLAHPKDGRLQRGVGDVAAVHRDPLVHPREVR